MDPKKLSGLSEDEVVAEISKNPAEARQIAALLVDGAGLIVRGARIKGRSDDQAFGDVVAQLAKTEEVDVSTPHGIVLAVVVAEFALRANPA